MSGARAPVPAFRAFTALCGHNGNLILREPHTAMTANVQRAFVLSLLVLLMLGTRINHFAPIPDASWAVFFIGGFHLRSWTRWAFPLLMVLAVAIDWAVISSQGMDFWGHYCVSSGYWALVPAYFAMWAGGMLLRHWYKGVGVQSLGLFAATLVVSVAVCHLFAQGGFYWTSSVVAEPTVAGWAKNYTDWLLPYLRTAAIYTGVAALAQVAVEAFGRQPANDRIAH